jgi:elongation factor G
VVKKASFVLLEPIMATEVVTLEEFMGDIVGDLNRRRGEVAGMVDKSGAKVITAKVPLSEQFGYVTVLRTLSSGRATSSMEFSHYQEVPRGLAEKVLENVKGRIDLL